MLASITWHTHLCMGILSVMYFTCAGSMASTIAVLTTAGASAFIVIPGEILHKVAAIFTTNPQGTNQYKSHNAIITFIMGLS